MHIPVRSAAAAALLALGLTLPAAGFSDTMSGAYLAGRQAAQKGDYQAAARYYSRALLRDRTNPALMESAALAYLAMGDLDKAYPIARNIEAQGLRSQIAHMVVIANLVAEGEYDALLARDPETLGVGPLADGLLKGWALMGTGAVARALEQFDTVAGQPGLRDFALYHKALALASAGDFEGAEALFSEGDGRLTSISRRAVLARAEILSQLDRNAEAREMLTDVFGSSLDPSLAEIARRLETGEKLPFSLVRNTRDGMAEVFFSIGAALNGEASDDFSLVYIRTASYLRPDNIDALLLSAELLEEMGQYDLSVALYRQVPPDSPDYHAAELGRAEALRRAAKPDAAIEVLERLAQDQPDLTLAHSQLGDLFRQQQRYSEAVAAYSRALQLTAEDARSRWFLLYARGIGYERLKDWPRAEADFRAALDLNPDQPQVLNYLGYSLVERREKLDEALDMIERAVAGRPDSGYIVDSLGWVLFRLGRYDESVIQMERAVELMPVDPVVNDHLGDVYWAVGRFREAEFQWKRALSFVDPEDADAEADPDRIRRKLEIGLDAVLVEEGAAPLRVANDG